MKSFDQPSGLRTLRLERRPGRAPDHLALRVDSSPSRIPADAGTDEESELERAWRKVFRARELLDAEVKTLREQQAAVRSKQAELECRETVLVAQNKALAQREAQVAAREQAVRLAAERAREATLRHRLKQLFRRSST